MLFAGRRTSIGSCFDVLALTLVKQASGGTALETIRYLDKQTLASVIPIHLACDFQGKTGRSLDRKNREGVAICCGSVNVQETGKATRPF